MPNAFGTDAQPYRMTFQTLISSEDASVNHILKTEDGGAFECRFVRRTPEYFIVYLSSHSGCDRACRMCHLTQTGQTMMTPASHYDYVAQARQVLARYKAERTLADDPAFINYNFMARGEPFANAAILNGGHPALFRALLEETRLAGVGRAQLNYSTIMPASLGDRSLVSFLGPSHPGLNIYYSLYSMRPAFRRRWLPKALDPNVALDALAQFQHTAADYGREPGEIVLHWSFIKGQNDDEETVDEIIKAVKDRGLKTRFNCVRYNSYSPAQGAEPDERTLAYLTSKLSEAFGDARSRIVPRVGMDVKASCGMFLEPQALETMA